MRDEWFPRITFPIGMKEFLQLPKSSIYKWEYARGQAELSARPKCYHCDLQLTPRAVQKHRRQWHDVRLSIRRFEDSDWSHLAKPFASAFDRVPPFCGMDDGPRLSAAQDCLDQTRNGGDGPLVKPACFVIADERGKPYAAALVTLYAEEWDSVLGRTLLSPGQSDNDSGSGVPHLTWIFVPPLLTRNGIGSALLDHSANALLELGYSTLASTFMLGNESSTMWHWTNGFKLRIWEWSPRSSARRTHDESI